MEVPKENNMTNVKVSETTSKFAAGDVDIIGFKHNQLNNTIEVTFRQKASNNEDGNLLFKPTPDRVWKEIYGVDEDGFIAMLSVKNGEHKPSYMVPEEFIFDGDEDENK